MAEWDTLEIIQTAAQIWTGLTIPGAGAGLTITGGEPDATENPTRKHVGHTSEGSEVLVKPSYNEFTVDESPAPIKRTPNTVEIAIAANLVQLEDMDVAALMLPGIATKSTPAGHIRLTFGLIPVVYTCAAIIWPRETNSAKYGYAMIYRASNDEGLSIQFGRTKMAGSAISLKGHAITSRAATDQYGQYDLAT